MNPSRTMVRFGICRFIRLCLLGTTVLWATSASASGTASSPIASEACPPGDCLIKLKWTCILVDEEGGWTSAGNRCPSTNGYQCDILIE